ncbi:hypothetical protein GCM10011371_16400 [Novosphingobium marinum]|uniref:Uncharacterized protein n=1 Tax=Novosphingobium marinum TaxID=1514948 RepID=A0A7Y9XYR6_9SPHN|nr:hypothetical protein [Novosphingobium marinum]NYH95753.1 hypothetical protein [Novosphingobium marinum]GGC29602.1 hypothetical protein GCM10011371_16400 [Novosphingobium marinum]
MAEKNRKTSGGKQPITRHPLFPATVALWFGALFGLGSLAIRTSLLESVVIATGIDSIFAAAAPPLGSTARILLALAATGLGGIIGASIARRLARPAPEKRERKRGAVGKARFDDPSGEADDDEPDARVFAAKGQAARRRSLAMEEDTGRPDYEDRAPLPGARTPYLNVEEVGFDGLRDSDQQPVGATDEQSSAEEAHAADFAALRNSSFVPPADEDKPLPDAASLFDRYASEKRPEPEKQVFVPVDEPDVAQTDVESAEPADAGGEPGPCEIEGTDSEDSSRIIDLPAASQDEDLPEPAQAGDLDQAVADAEVDSGEPVGAHRQDNRLFGEGADKQVFTPTRIDFSRFQPTTPADVEQYDEHLVEEGEATGEISGEAKAFATGSVPVPQNESEAASAAERIGSAELGDLSHVELLERLALSMERRRQAVAETIVEASPKIMVAEVSEDARNGFAAAMAASEEEPVIGEFDAEDDTGTPEAALTEPHAPFSPPVPRIPAALKPVSIEEPDDFDDDDALPSFVPPRHFAMPTEAAAVDGDDAASAGSNASSPSTETEEVEDEDSQVLAQGYSSLLNLSKPGAERQEFVRIEEPEPEAGAVEPVVVFPGQDPVAETRREAEAEPARPFDKPEPPEAEKSRKQVRDPEEAERALRAALATLQRMSGAA